MNPAQLLNPKAFAKEKAKANKKTPNYGTCTAFSIHCDAPHLPAPVCFTSCGLCSDALSKLPYDVRAAVKAVLVRVHSL